MGKNLPNIGVLGWGISGESSFMGALARIMEYYNEYIDYIDLMGFSGAAFRINIAQPQWCPSAPDMFPKLHFSKYLGYELTPYFNPSKDESKRIETQKDFIKLIKKEINKNHPVIAIDLVEVPEWGIITGYKRSDLYCRTYYDGIDKNYDKHPLPAYNVAQKIPWGLFTAKKIGEPLDRKISVKESLIWVLKHWSVGKIEESSDGYYANGINAYETWIEQLQDEDRHQYSHEQTHQQVSMANVHNFLERNPYLMNMMANAWMYNAYYDARATAVQFIERLSSEYKGVTQDLIRQLLDVFKIIENYWYEGWLDFPFPFWVDWEHNRINCYGKHGIRYVEGITVWDSTMRKRSSHTLKLIREEEKKAYSILARLVKFL
ncbi:MAG: hypothetical protein EU530_09290 [Promethearchaeota archaeon]|nr:MAG: hypothetical protein EU530_09290 [Candidatus Lokiarchaeota archaeon]